MKITASRVDDVLRRKAEYESARDAYDRASKASWQNYRSAVKDVTGPIESAIQSELNKFDLLTFNVDVAEDFDDNLKVDINCNQHRVNDINSALAWNWSVKVDSKTGELVKGSSSWSGMKVTNDVQLQSFYQSYQALKYLNNVDWKSMLDITLPEYRDFVDDSIVQPKYQSFDDELRDATLSDLVGQSKAIAIHNPHSDSIVFGAPIIFIKVLKESPSQVTVGYAPGTDSWGRHAQPDPAVGKDCAAKGYFTANVGRIAKRKINICKPEVIIDL